EILVPIRPARPPDDFPQFNPRYVAVTHCTNVRPGTCCRPITPLTTNGQFSNLPPGAISAFWGPEVHTTILANGCNERTLESHYGSPQWAWQDPVFPPRISGASYVSCPLDKIDRGWGTVLAGFCSRLKRRGAVSVSAPPTTADPAWVWPDIIMVNGVNYTDNRKGDLLYYDMKDTLLNFTRLMEKKS
ncbi:hypothetical protein MMC14_010196, partial [Varicellaria rhodocarpa]|nr:hypothetical protein [Varicellaria rhodocarpa]